MFESSRTFQLWKYLVGHRQLLLRSNRSEAVSTRLDVLFKNVTVINLPTHLDGLSVALAPEHEAESVRGERGVEARDGQQVYSVRGQNYRGYVIAGSIFTHEDDGDYAAPSALLVE